MFVVVRDLVDEAFLQAAERLEAENSGLHVSRRHDIQDATGRIEYLPGRGTVQAWGSSAPTDSVAGFAPGCIYHNLAGTAGSTLYSNIGTFSSSNWLNIT